MCRNTLMYLNSETQSHVLARFSFALREGGYLALGKAEMLLAHSDLFTPVDLKRRVFRKVPGATLRERLMVLTDAGDRQPANPGPRQERIRTAALEASPEAQIVVDAGGHLAMANAKARGLFNLGPDDIGRPFQDLEISYRPLELRSKLQQAYVERLPSPVYEVEWPNSAGEAAHLEVQITPLVDEQQVLLGASVSFADVTRSRRYKEELEHANQGLEDAYAELQSTNEELETTNEELQSTVEELETTNEELQSTNEELETMNEEMQSTNEELQTINDELGERTTELNQLNAFLESIWAGLGGAVAVLDPDLRVLVWNHGSEDLWGVRQEEVQGQHFLNLDIGLPVDQVHPALRQAMAAEGGSHSTVVQATNRRGKSVRCRVTCSPLVGTVKTSHRWIVSSPEWAWVSRGYDRAMRWTEVPAVAWRTPQELVEEGFRRSRVVMLNEAHDGLTRCVRTRQLGRQLLPSAHAMGVRHLAMEALQPGDAEAANTTRRPPDAAGGYLAQPDMAALIQAALALGWTLWRYEADIDHAPAALVEQGFMSQAFTNWREIEQANNLAAVFAGLATSDRLLVWCGNGHASRFADDDWTSMGHHFAALVAEGAFVIDQTVTVAFPGREQQQAARVAELAPILDQHGGTAGLLVEEAGPLACWPGVDALIVSTDNAMT